MTTFCDVMDYCEVWGHKEEFVREYCIDIIGNIIMEYHCEICDKTKEIMKPRNDLRMSETIYPSGLWH